MARKTEYLPKTQGDRTGDILRLLPGNIGYADLDRLPVPRVDEMFDKFKDCSAIIFDDRGYPQGTAWHIAPRLTEKQDVVAAIFRRLDPDWPDFPLPGGISIHFSGQGVRHADGRQLQRIGLEPLVEVRPTLAGIRAGKDEVLDKAVDYLSHGLQ